MSRTRRAAAIFAFGSIVSCRTAVTPPAIDPAMAARVPAGTIALAGLNLDQLRASPLYAQLPRAMVALVEPFRGARSLLAAFSGKDLLVIASGAFVEAPAGTTLVAPGLALAGSSESVRAAEAGHKAPELLAQAESVAPGNQIWIVTSGDVTLPLTGNAANVNRMLRNMEFAAVTVRAPSAVEFAIAARGRTPDAARRFEETLRAALTMAAVAEAKQSDLAAIFRSIQVSREDRTVHAALSTGTAQARKLLDLLTP